ncbi:MAG TPA: hypothetical protein VNA14_10720 [Mycobacteriales bacterium]|nr:hypothetical protein [Mycobacteriales bacterium]
MTQPIAHPASEELAAYAAGDLEDSGVVRAHVIGCSSCATSVAGVQRATTALASLPSLAMPVDVITALERALADEVASGDRPPGDQAPEGITSIAAARRRRTGRAGPIAAAAAVIGLAAALGAGVLRDGAGDDSAPLAGAAAEQDTGAGKAAPIILRSGTDYSAEVLDVEVRDRLGSAESPALTAQAPAADGTGGDARTAGSAEAASLDMAAAAPTLTDEELQSCVDELSGTPGTAALLVDFATYAGEPAVVVVLPFREGRVDVFVVRPQCRVGNDALIFFKRVAAET